MNVAHSEGGKGYSMTPQSVEIRTLASAGAAEELLGVLQEAIYHPETEAATYLETAGLKAETHDFFQQTKGRVSAIYDDMPRLAEVVNPIEALGEYGRLITERIKAFDEGWWDIIGAGLSPEDAKFDVLGKLVERVEDWRSSGEAAPIQSQLAVLGDKRWDNSRLREVIAGNWCGGVRESLWGIVVEAGQEAAAQLSSGQSVGVVDAEYRSLVEYFFDDAIQTIDRAVSETQPETAPSELQP